MLDIIVLEAALKHGISESSILQAWDNFASKRPRIDYCCVFIGFDNEGTEIEMVGLETADLQILIIHAMSPATEKIRRELGIAR